MAGQQPLVGGQAAALPGSSVAIERERSFSSAYCVRKASSCGRYRGWGDRVIVVPRNIKILLGMPRMMAIAALAVKTTPRRKAVT